MNMPLSFHDERSPDGRAEPSHRASHHASSSPPRARPFFVVTLVGALMGTLFSAVSTHDFVSHLDRQVHSIHCSFLPIGGSEIGESGCRTVMMSPWSSMFRESLWGGIPLSLLSLAVFAYLVMRVTQLLLARGVTKRETLFVVAATALPVVMSVIYGVIAATQIGAVCKLCVGVYVSSAVAFVGAIVAHQRAEPSESREPPTGLYARWFIEGCAYVFVLVGFYVLFAPTSAKTTEGCGTLVKRDEPSVMISLGAGEGTRALSVLDPLCSACKGFDERLRASDLYARLDMRAVLFPLDASCNWMVKESIHPGACTVSEAMLCDLERAEQVLDFAFVHQAELLELGKESEAKLRRRLEGEFAHVKGCLGSAKVKNLVNKSLRFAVANALPVLTPQLFVEDTRVCDEDTDLGLEYTVARMLEGDDAPKSRRRGKR